jgi:HPt (histidine-containing phosphotransfer) domain-containing protein
MQMATSTIPLLDPAPLQRQTMGDTALRVEVLALFVAEVERLMRQLEDAPSPQVRTERLHAIAGVARNVGATRLAQTARMLAGHVGEEEAADLTPVRAAAAETLAFVRASGV